VRRMRLYKRSPNRKARQPELTWLVLGVLLVAPALALGAWVTLNSIPDPTLSGQIVPPVVVPVTATIRQASTALVVEVVQQPPQVATSSATGTVTTAAVTGATLNNGDVVLEVDDKPVRAMVSDAPLWRPLTSGDRGADVQRLEQFLSDIGYFHGTPNEIFDSATMQAVREFAVDIGLPRSITAFDPAWVIWVGSEPLTVAQANATVGTAVGPGTVVATGDSGAAAVIVQEPQGGLGADFGAVAELVAGNFTTDYQVHSGLITDPNAVQEIAAYLAPQTEGTVQIRAEMGTEVLVVPASSIVTNANGEVCVYPDAANNPLVVMPIGGGGATVQIPKSVGITTVLSNPNQLASLPPCG